MVNLCDDLKILIKDCHGNHRNLDDNDSDEQYELNYNKSMFFVWRNLVDSKRNLLWNVASSIQNKFQTVQDAVSGVQKVECEFPISQQHSTYDDAYNSGGKNVFPFFTIVFFFYY